MAASERLSAGPAFPAKPFGRPDPDFSMEHESPEVDVRNDAKCEVSRFAGGDHKEMESQMTEFTQTLCGRRVSGG